MPAGTHEILDQTREAIERRAMALLATLHESEDIPIAEEHRLIEATGAPSQF